ncbi:unnamed protein product, partial [Medioppia subpectinata]
SAYGLISLVNTYGLDIKSLINGFIKYDNGSGDEVVIKSIGLQNQSLNAFDCYLMGKLTFENMEYSNAMIWLTQAITKIDNKTTDETIAETFKYLSSCEQEIGISSEAQRYLRISMAIKPDIESVKQQIKSEIKLNPIYGLSENGDQLCRGEKLLNDSIVSQLNCYFLNTTEIPFLRLTRIKVEEMYKRPQILVIHDFMSDNETQTMISMTKPSLRRLKVVKNNESDSDEVGFNIRVANGNWLYDKYHPVLQTVSRRIGAITGLNTTYAEAYNVIKYSVGGYYDYHYDSSNAYRESNGSQRIGTWINYLADVEAGGATVFPLLNVTVLPEKSAALFWHNLYDSGDTDRLTLHSECPVLVGDKWIATKWIRTYGQEFLKPCLNKSGGISITLNEDKESLLRHPINVYLLTRRIAIEWQEVKHLLGKKDKPLFDIQRNLFGVDCNRNTTLKNTSEIMTRFDDKITNKDMINSAYGLISLVNTYGLDIKSLINGFIKYNNGSGDEVVIKSIGLQNQTLNAFDCYLIGKLTFENMEYSKAMIWLTEGITKIDNKTTDETIVEIFKYLSSSEQKMRNSSEAQKYLRISMAINPDLESVKQQLKSETKLNPIYGLSENGDQLCRGEKLLNDSIVSQLNCYFLNTTEIPFLRLTRIKVEEMYKRPQILVIHDFMSENETKTMISMTKPSLRRLKVVKNNESNKSDSDKEGLNIRVANGNWLYDRSDRVLQTVSRRIGAITGLNTSYAEPYNVVKYSVGGYYDYHYDSSNAYRESNGSQLMVTWINYLADVEAGGATVFPLLNVTVLPEKSAALFWHNLYDSGDTDPLTLHSGCPVLVGDKWIATKWIRTYGQEFLKPCLNDSRLYIK